MSFIILFSTRISVTLSLLVCITAANAFATMYSNNKWGPTPIQETREKKKNIVNPMFSSVDIEAEKHSVIEERRDPLSLDSIRASLIRQEETIIFALIERAQFCNNEKIYEKGAFGDLIPPGINDGFDLSPISFHDYMLIGTEMLHSAARRYISHEEQAFFPKYLEQPVLPPLEFPDILSPIGGACDVNFNSVLLKRYISDIVPSITERGDDGQYGSSAVADVTALQALSRRIHYGKFVAESKYCDKPEEYQKLVDAGDVDGVWNLLTNMEVEKKVLRRSRLKAATYGREPLLAHMPEIEGGNDSDKTSIVAAAAAAAVVAAVEAYGEEDKTKKLGKVDPEAIEKIYLNLIIPLTKEIEVAYLFLRCGKDIPAKLTPSNLKTKP